MSTPVIGFLVAIGVIAAIYFLFVVPGERKYHETKLRLMQERIERHQRSRDRGDSSRDPGHTTANRAECSDTSCE